MGPVSQALPVTGDDAAQGTDRPGVDPLRVRQLTGALQRGRPVRRRQEISNRLSLDVGRRQSEQSDAVVIRRDQFIGGGECDGCHRNRLQGLPYSDYSLDLGPFGLRLDTAPLHRNARRRGHKYEHNLTGRGLGCTNGWKDTLTRVILPFRHWPGSPGAPECGCGLWMRPPTPARRDPDRTAGTRTAVTCCHREQVADHPEEGFSAWVRCRCPRPANPHLRWEERRVSRCSYCRRHASRPRRNRWVVFVQRNDMGAVGCSADCRCGNGCSQQGSA